MLSQRVVDAGDIVDGALEDEVENGSVKAQGRTRTRERMGTKYFSMLTFFIVTPLLWIFL